MRSRLTIPRSPKKLQGVAFFFQRCDARVVQTRPKQKSNTFTECGISTASARQIAVETNTCPSTVLMVLAFHLNMRPRPKKRMGAYERIEKVLRREGLIPPTGPMINGST